MRSNRYVSFLGAEIEPKAISNLARYEQLTEATMNKLERLGSRTPAALGGGLVSPSSIRGLQQTRRAAQETAAQISRVGNAARRTAADTGVMATSLTRASQALNVVQGPLGPLAGRLAALSGVLRELTGFSLAGVLGGGGAFALGSIASNYQAITDRLRPYYDTQEQVNKSLQEVIGIAGRTRQALDPIAELYTRITTAGRDAGIAQERYAKITETVAKAARLSGTSQQSQAAGIQQFAQGFGSGTLSGDELKSIRENVPRLAKAIADGLGLPVAMLKELGTQGKLTPQIIADALAQSAAQIDVEMSRVPVRIGAALTQSGNNITTFVGRLDEATGATAGLAKGIMLVGDNIPTVVAGLGTLAVALNVKGLVNAGSAVSALIARNIDYGKSLRDTTAILNNRAAIESALASRATTRASAEVAAALAARQAATESRTAAQAAIATGVEAERQLERQIVLIKQQQVAQRSALRTAELLAAATAVRNGTAVPVAGSTAAAGASPAAVAAANALARTNATLLATERALQAAQAETRAATAKATGSFYAQVAAKNELTVANLRLVAAQKAEAVAIAASAAASVRATLTQRALGVATAGLTVVVNGVKAAWAGLSAVLGGPVGIAITAAAGAMFYLSTRTDAALEAAQNFEGGQDALRKALGLTTSELSRQTDQARALAEQLAVLGVQRAKEKTAAVGEAVGSGLRQAAFNIGARGSARDRNLLNDIAGRADRNALEAKDVERLIAIQKRNQDAFKRLQTDTPGDLIGSLFGTDPSKSIERLMGLTAATIEQADAEKNLAAVRKELAQPRVKDRFGLLAKPKTKAELDAEVKAEVAGTNAVKKAKAELARVEAVTEKARRAGTISEADYISQRAEATKAVDAAVAAEKAQKQALRDAAKGKKEAAAEARKLATEDNRAAAAAEKLADIMARYDDAPRAIDRAANDKRALEALIGQRVNRGSREVTYTPQDYERDAARIDRETRRPAQDSLRDQQRELEYIRLAMQGREDEAEVLRQKYQIIDTIGDMLPEEEAAWRKNNAEIYAGNRALDERRALIDIYAQQINDVSAAARNFIADLMGGDAVGAAKSLFKNLKQAFITSKANEIAVKLFGDPEQKFRDQMTRGLNSSATKLSNSASALSQAAADLSAVSTSGAVGGTALAPLAALQANPVVESLKSVGDMAVDVAELASVINDDIMQRGGMAAPDVSNTGDIVVTAAKAVAAAPQVKGAELPKNATQAMNKAAKDLVGSIVGANSPLTKVAGKLGTFFEGAGYGTLAGSLVKGLGVKTSATGSAIGGGLGQIGGEMLGKTFSKALGSLSKFAGPLGAIAGGILGGVIGGLFKKTPKASATVTSTNAETGISRVSGSSTNLKNQAGALGSSVQQGLLQVAEAFGGSADGAFSVSIGTRKGKYRVDPTGRGKTKGGSVADFGEDADAAVKYAILDAIMDGAVKGIRAGSLRLLQAGKDLDASLSKALRFEQVFTDLKTILDPVGAAVDALNKEFTGLINLFGEAGASAEEYAQLEQLYGLKREEAIKNATNGALSAIRDFISSRTAGADSPLDKRTVYNNAQSEADLVRAKIQTGARITDEDIKKLEQLDAASRALFGSRSAYFSDFKDVLELAKKAESNYTASAGSVAGSPFDTAEVKSLLGSQVSESQKQTDLLEQIAQALAVARVVSGSYNGSTIGLLPVNQS